MRAKQTKAPIVKPTMRPALAWLLSPSPLPPVDSPTASDAGAAVIASVVVVLVPEFVKGVEVPVFIVAAPLLVVAVPVLVVVVPVLVVTVVVSVSVTVVEVAVNVISTTVGASTEVT
jgi:hypothetical protein